jgi:small subunit ribosomal protein S21
MKPQSEGKFKRGKHRGSTGKLSRLSQAGGRGYASMSAAERGHSCPQQLRTASRPSIYPRSSAATRCCGQECPRSAATRLTGCGRGRPFCRLTTVTGPIPCRATQDGSRLVKRAFRSRWRGRESVLTEINLKKGESVERALRRLKKKVDREGTLKVVRNHRHFEKPSEKRRRKEKAARFSAMLSARYADM